MKRIHSIALAGVLSVGLVLQTTPVTAIAVTSSELQEQLSVVQTELDGLYGEAEQVSEQLNDTRYELKETQKRIDENTEAAAQKEIELTEAKQTLTQIIAEDYKDGGVSLLSMILGSGNIEGFVSNIYYANKVSENRREAIATVREISAELDKERAALVTDKAKQEELLVQQEELQEELQANIDETEAYVGSLSVQIQDALAAEEAARQEAARKEAEAAQRAAEEAARKEAEAKEAEEQAQAQAREQAEETKQTQTKADTTNTNANTNTRSTTTDTDTSESPKPTVGPSSSSSGTIPSGVANTIISAAASQIGCGYRYGAASPGVAFDCSGLVSYAYACAGYSVPHSSAALSAYCNKSVSQAVPGDILWMPGHVGIYIGGGMTIEAFNPGTPLGYGSASKFVSAGSPAAL